MDIRAMRIWDKMQRVHCRGSPFAVSEKISRVIEILPSDVKFVGS